MKYNVPNEGPWIVKPEDGEFFATYRVTPRLLLMVKNTHRLTKRSRAKLRVIKN